MGLAFEAERLVRLGESRAEVSRRLGVHVSTLSQWALRGGWRKKDLDMERTVASTRATILAIREGNSRVDRRNALRGRLAEVWQEALELLAEGSEASLDRVMCMIGGMEQQGKLEPPKVVMPVDPLVAKIGSLGDADLGGDRTIYRLDEEDYDPD